ncbi:unnamed protein product [Somion occarium]|uniref:Uncharacterized protein n=1 Tax=Somion occarium TaxID=3059160 RepID=A0ABP1DNB6_9APHY
MILELAICDNSHGRPSDILRVNSTFRTIGEQVLYKNLKFYSSHQLQLFSEGKSPVKRNPRTLLVQLSGGSTDFDVFIHLAGVLRRCGARLPCPTSFDEGYQIPLERFSLCLHSHARSCQTSTLSLWSHSKFPSPKIFEWMGPDPKHHFSIAIVPTAAHHLFKAIATWSAIEHIVLTNLSFPPEYLGIPVPTSPPKPLLPPLSSLRTLYLGQATFVNPNTIAATVCLPDQHNLESVHLVDTYRESIWGPRIRRSDLEHASLTFQIEMPPDARIARIRQIVKCEALTERIMGGDRVEGLLTLD